MQSLHFVKGIHVEEICGEKKLIQKIEHVHNDPVWRGYVEEAKHRHYSTERNREEMKGQLEVRTDWTTTRGKKRWGNIRQNFDLGAFPNSLSCVSARVWERDKRKEIAAAPDTRKGKS